MNKNQRIAIVPGSFDPITNGHISIIEEAARLYDKVFVAVMINADKQYMFSLELIVSVSINTIPCNLVLPSTAVSFDFTL